jgi:hypothetical protein
MSGAMRLVVLAALAACHGPAVPAVPSKGGPAWLALESEHFTVWTDSSRARARALIREMEHLRQVVLGVGFSGSHVDGKSFVIALRDADEAAAFLPEQFAAFASTGGTIHQPVIVLPADAREDNKPLVTHELVHVISFNTIRNQPSWFAEGLAEFFASVNTDPDETRGDVGKPQASIVARLRRRAPTPSAQMFACKTHACMDDMFYATAWAIFAYLANTHPRELVAFARRLDELPAGAWTQAWSEVFPQLTTGRLDHEVRKWLAYGKHKIWTFEVELRQWPVTERSLRDADVYAARAMIRELLRRIGDPPPSELAHALALDPTHLHANLVKLAYTKSIDLALAKRIAEAHPDDWRAWWLVGYALQWKGDEARAAWERACALYATQPSPALARWCKR